MPIARVSGFTSFLSKGMSTSTCCSAPRMLASKAFPPFSAGNKELENLKRSRIARVPSHSSANPSSTALVAMATEQPGSLCSILAKITADMSNMTFDQRAMRPHYALSCWLKYREPFILHIRAHDQINTSPTTPPSNSQPGVPLNYRDLGSSNWTPQRMPMFDKCFFGWFTKNQ